LNQIADWDWARNNWLYTLTEMLFDAHIYGTGLTDLDFDQKKDSGLGRIAYRSKDIFYFYPYPDAKDINDNCPYAFYAEIVDIEEIKRRYPEKGKFVKGNNEHSIVMNRSEAQFHDQKYQNPTDGYIVTGENPKNFGERKETVLFQCWWADEDFEEKQKTTKDENGELVTSYEQSKKYPNGRFIAFAENVLLVDKENPLEEGIIPFQKMVNYIDPRQFWGISEIENLDGPQKILNKILSFTLDVLTMTGNPIWIVDNTSGVDTDNIYNRPGEIIEKNKGSEVRREEGTQLQPYVLNLVDRYKTWIDELSGAQDITRGVRPEGVSAASAIQELQQAAQTRIRQKSRILDNYLQTLGQQYLAFVFQYYTIPQIVRVTNKDNPLLQDYFKFHVDVQVDENGESKKVARITPYNLTDQGYKEGDEKILALNKKFDVKVTTGSSLPFSKVEKEQRLFNLYDRQIIDAEQVLKDMEYPNYQAILARTQQKQLQLQEQQTAAVPDQGQVAGNMTGMEY